MSEFNKILDKYRKYSFSERDKGDRFERLMQTYLRTDPKYANLFKKVWLWNEFPGKIDLGGNDTGIDLVALTYDGDYWAVQCKCYQETSHIDKPAVDSFLSTSSREFKNEDLKTTRFSQRLWISTTNKWGPNATQAIKNQNPPVARINLYDLYQAPVDWGKLDEGIHGEASLTKKKTPRKHQLEAIEKTHLHFQDKDRGKLIMACGTGKTYTSLCIAEKETNHSGLILFLVPSIALLGQTLREWSAEAHENINAICICSDPEISKKRTKNDDNETISIVDLAWPASTNSHDILHQFDAIEQRNQGGMTVVFSTYQSIEVIARAQKELLKNGYPEFDLIVCDEAHRTTGVTIASEDESAFTKVHSNEFIKAKKRLYMTATPRLYDDNVKSKAAQAEAILCSMDDKDLYGEEIYRIGFGEAVDEGLLTDYKVLILTLNENDVPPAVQKMIADGEYEINSDDGSKLIGCINALSKQMLGDDGVLQETDPNPMRRALAFCPSIAASKTTTTVFNTASETYLDALPVEKKSKMVSVASEHIDGTMSAPQRDELIGWLKADTEDNECRILTNVRCLSEGVDVPSLDAVLFLSARNSQVDVVQSVGRVMRLSPDTNKKYGYIIIPIVVPSDIEAEVALNDNERYKVVWTVLNALRAHDDRFNATVNKIELNKNRPNQILVGRPETTFDSDGAPQSAWADEQAPYHTAQDLGAQMALQFEQLQHVIFAKMVKNVGDKRYWEQWAKDVAIIAENQISKIKLLIKDGGEHEKAFTQFLNGLQKNINPSITQDQAIEMLAQHIITKPVFEALFEGYSFVKNNAISTAMQAMLDALQGKTVDEDSETLQKFYESVRKRAAGIDNAEGKQRIIIELYDKFFKTAFPKMVDQLGIVYTPVEVVDFIIHSVNDVLKKEFDRSISDENIHILDPFTGTGTFITRLLQSGLIKAEDLERKYKHELHANEIVLLAYYIAAVNIENAFHDQLEDKSEYQSFEGIVLTDTFQLGETDESEKLFSEMFPQNSARVARQKKAPLRVIMGNPPYSIGQKSANDNAQNQSYPKLDGDIAKTYAKLSKAGLNKSLYDAYIKAFRWSTDKLDPINGGVIAFVSNGAWLDGNSTDGFRLSLEKEFSSIYIFNLRGNQRTSGELSRKEGGKIFGSGSRTPISITLLVKNPKINQTKAKLRYHDIGDYLNREEKLSIVKKFRSIVNEKLELRNLKPNEFGDWLSQRNDAFNTYIPIEPDKKFNLKTQTFFNTYAIGVASNRDAWVYNFSSAKIEENMIKTIEFYNEQIQSYARAKSENDKINCDEFIDTNASKISWTVNLKKDLEKLKAHNFMESEMRSGLYRPYMKQNLYFDKPFIERPGLAPKLFPNKNFKNRLITVTGQGASKTFSVLISSEITNLDTLEKAQCFPLYYYEENNHSQKGLFDNGDQQDYIRRDGISDFILDRAKKQYGKNVEKEDIFYYAYGFLHSPSYREKFANDLKKMLPRLPLVDDVRDFWKFSKAGRALANLHLNYEEVEAYPNLKLTGENSGFYTVEKMRFPKKNQKDTIIYNSKVCIENIPAKAYEYIVNGKSAIEWIMERYAVTTHKDSGIKNDPNDWATEVGNPRYILDLLLSIINVSVQTVDIVNSLPVVDFEEEKNEVEKTNVYSIINKQEMKGYSLHHPLYNLQDVMYILRLKRDKVKNWFDELYNPEYKYPGIGLDAETKELKISFHGLIELAAIKDLRENKIPLNKILKARDELKAHFNVDYPFATEVVLKAINKAGKTIVFDDGFNLSDLGGTKQLNFEFIRQFFKSIYFEDGLATRMYPVGNEKRIVVDPAQAGGRVYVASTDGLWVEQVGSLFRTYNDKKQVSKVLEITEAEVEDSLTFLSLN
ncbi:MAG TPA: type ISP restriction/modification enzyme [Pelobium sp.]|nr:type ISP restriction/modification enzyme [Pelobium sp.]